MASQATEDAGVAEAEGKVRRRSYSPSPLMPGGETQNLVCAGPTMGAPAVGEAVGPGDLGLVGRVRFSRIFSQTSGDWRERLPFLPRAVWGAAATGHVYWRQGGPIAQTRKTQTHSHNRGTLPQSRAVRAKCTVVV